MQRGGSPGQRGEPARDQGVHGARHVVRQQHAEMALRAAEGVIALGDRLAEHLLLGDRKSTRLNSSHTVISYAVFCLKKKSIRRRVEAAACVLSRRVVRAAVG